MATNRTVLENQLTPGAQILVRGNVSFARLTRRVEGEELEKDKQRRQRDGRLPIDKPYTTISIYNARVIPKNPNGQLTPDEVYVQESFYTSQKQDNPGWNYTIVNKSPFMPSIAQVRQDDNRVADQVKPEGEPARGLDVVLLLRVFQSKNYGALARKGIAFDGIIAQEPIRYYNANDVAHRLAERGITYNALPPSELADLNPAAGAPLEENTDTNVPTGTPVSAPTGNPFNAKEQAPATPNGFPMNTPTSAPAQAATPNTGFGNGVPTGGYNPFAGNAQQTVANNQGGGIKYDPNDPNRNY